MHLKKGLMRLTNTNDEVIGPINLGNPTELTILGLAKTIFDITLARSLLDWKPTMPLEDGLKKTIAYYARLLNE